MRCATARAIRQACREHRESLTLMGGTNAARSQPAAFKTFEIAARLYGTIQRTDSLLALIDQDKIHEGSCNNPIG